MSGKQKSASMRLIPPKEDTYVFINPKMIEAGLAIVSIQHAKDASLYALQDKARQNCRGIWSQDITKIYNEKKLSGLSPHGKTIEITNNPKCHIKFAIN